MSDAAPIPQVSAPAKSSVLQRYVGGDNKVINLNAVRYNMMRSLLGVGSMGRGLLSRLTGGSFGGKRDLYDSYGWDRSIDSAQMWQMYARGGIARRIVHAYPDAVWGSPPTFEGTTQAWMDAWETMAEDLKIWSVLHRLDRISQLGQYAILLIGTDDGSDLSRPLNTSKARKILYLQPYSDRSAVISEWGRDPGKPNFNMPEIYTIYPDQAAVETGMMGTSGQVQSSPSRSSFRVHYSRVIHVTQSQLESEVFSCPMLWACWNYLTDLMKVVGGSAESYWQTANRGMHADLEKDMELEPEDEAALTEELDEYHNGQRRFIRTRGVTVKSLGSDVADPKGPFETLVTLIAGTTGIPKRVLIGSESGHNASTQDKGAIAEHVEEYRTLVAIPNFLRPLLKFCTDVGALPKTSGKKKPKEVWPDAYRLSPLEAAQRGNQSASAANNLGLALKTMPNLMDRKEARHFVGLKDDGKNEKLEIVQAPTKQKAGDKGVETPGPGSGETATPGSDTNGRGDPPQQRK